MIMFLLVVWFITGFLFELYVLTKQRDFLASDIFMTTLAGLLGPIHLIAYYSLSGRGPVLIKKRESK